MIMGLSERLKEMRVKLGLSQREVAKILELSPSVVSAYETGERTPSTETLLRLSNLYKCSTDYLLGKVEEKAVAVVDITDLTDLQVKAIMTVLKGFREEMI